jgi:phenylacetic acid degradation operon negative regulatory protein
MGSPALESVSHIAWHLAAYTIKNTEQQSAHNVVPQMKNAFSQFLATLDPAPLRTWSLIVTFYGDFIMPRGGELWLTTLSEVLGVLDIKSNSVRAAMRRLEQDGYLERRRQGRTSHYALSQRALTLSHEAEALIYRRVPPVSARGWDIVVPERAADRKALEAEGFRALIPGMHIRPVRGGGTVPQGTLHLVAHGDDAAIAGALYPLAAIAARYEAFLAAVPIIASRAAEADPLAAVILRLALVHGFRRIVLRDPHLAPAALPPAWPAARAYQAFADTYAALVPASERWIDAHARNAAGPLDPAATPGRFGGAQRGAERKHVTGIELT